MQDHRGARGSEVATGDGAGVLTSLPHAFLAKVARRDAGIELPEMLGRITESHAADESDALASKSKAEPEAKARRRSDGPAA